MHIETISRGAQFKGFVSLIGLIIFPFALIIGIALIIFEGILPGLLALAISAAAFFLFLDVRGVQIDLTQKLVRSYKQYIIWKRGEWKPLANYHSLQLSKDTVYLRAQIGTIGAGRGSASKISTYDVLLVSQEEDMALDGDFKREMILLSEFEKHHDAAAFMNKYATLLCLPSRDIYKELQQSAVSRRQARR
jgi:hypothetical protein